MAEKKQPRPLGLAVGEKILKADLEKYRSLAIELGASDAVIVPADWIATDERVRLKCTVPRCPRAGETPNCPPHTPDIDIVRRAVSRYSWAILFKCEVSPIEDYVPGKGDTKQEQRRVLLFHKKGNEIICSLERRAYKDGYHLAMGLGGGSCKDYLCQGMICQFLDSGRCRFPQRARPAIEAMGIDVISLINRVDWSAYALLDDLSIIPCAVTIGLIFIY